MSIQESHTPRADTPADERPSEQERIIHQLFEQVYSRGDLGLGEELVAPDYLGHWSDTEAVYSGPEGLKAHVIRLRSAFFGLSVEVDEVRGAGGRLEVHWTAHGRLERPFMGLEPACLIGAAGVEPHGPVVEMGGVTVARVTDGRLRTSETVWQYEGVQPPPSGHSANRRRRGNHSPSSPPPTERSTRDARGTDAQF